MKYTFQDSTELPIQRDFIKDIQEFIKLSKEVHPLEKASRLLNEEKKKGTISFENEVKALDGFETGITKAIQELNKNIEGIDITGVIDESVASISSICSKRKTELGKKLEDNVKTADFELDQLSTKIMSLLNSFFEGTIYNSTDTYILEQEDGSIRGKQISFAENMEYWFDLDLNSTSLKVEHFYKKFHVPIWVSGGLLHRENKVKNMDLSDHRIISMEYDGDEHLEALLKDDDSEHVFRIVADENTFMIFHNDHDITVDEELVQSLEEEEVLLLIKKMKQYFLVAVQSRVLSKVLIDGKDAISENRVFDCLKIIASKYGDLINECLDKGYNKEEITIKIERPDETRTEKYIAKAEIFSQLSDIGSEGLELADIMNVVEK
ncbi:hypothetical protein [Methanolobus profundi]|uniref:Chromosome segregation ATPase n=1 Tax=Methanolobus profundi TaxID=487685 RepID=A0A1I4THS0_9EURY|nr:hypothetical protein [Methanolobus profundi]SFM76205.1 hypothetical protein SAMN04488696_2271 [Methanolobus profundi]